MSQVGEPETTDPEEYREKWNAYIDGLGPLRNALPEDEYDRLNDAFIELRDLVDVAAEELE